jgi:cell division protein DivIC
MAASAEIRKKRKTRSSTAKKTMVLIIFVVAVLFISLAVLTLQLKEKVRISSERAASLETQILEEKNRTVEIEDLENYMKSDDYIEQVAKEKLGMVKDGEIIFKASD